MNNINLIDLKDRYEEEKDELLSIFTKVIESGNLILSDENSNLEMEICRFINSKFCLTLNSGTDALMMALWSLGIKKGDEVITSSVSFIATAAAIDHVGAKPVFVDVKNDLNIDENLIEEKITDKTKCIIPVHWTGRMCNMKSIYEIGKKHNLSIIEDAAQAIGSSLDGIKPGKYSDVATFSTHPLKILNALGDGGFLTTNNEQIYEKIKKYRNHGMVARDDYEFFGVNSRLDSLNAAVLRFRLKKVYDVISRRDKNINFYRDHIKTENFKIIKCKENETNSFTMFVSLAEDRDNLHKYLNENNIQSLIYYGKPLHLQNSSKKLGYKLGDFPNAERLCDSVISIPFHQHLSKDKLQYISEKINSFYKN